MNKVRKILLLSALEMLSACAHLRASPAPVSPFLTRPEWLHSNDSHLSWNAAWVKPNSKIMEFSTERRTLYIAPVVTTFTNSVAMGQDKQPKASVEDIESISKQIVREFSKQIEKNKQSHLELVDQEKSANLKLEIALTEIVPTKTLVNTVANLGSLVVPGSKVVQNSLAVGMPAAGGAYASGTIAIEMKISEIKGKKVTVVAEVKDRQSDPASILPNYRDFTTLGWAKETIEGWAVNFATSFSTPPEAKAQMPTTLSLVPW